MDEKAKKDIAEIIDPYIKKLGLELFKLDVKLYQKTLFIKIFVDKPEGGITVDQCTQINYYLGRILQENPIIEDYAIEVSSPGIDMPLKRQKDFSRVIGRSVRFHLIDFMEGKKEHTGIIKQVEKTHIVIQTRHKEMTITLDNISKAVQVI